MFDVLEDGHRRLLTPQEQHDANLTALLAPVPCVHCRQQVPLAWVRYGRQLGVKCSVTRNTRALFDRPDDDLDDTHHEAQADDVTRVLDEHANAQVM